MNEEYLAHYGVLGMKWGVRKDRKSSFSTRRMAKKDAKEFARAKASYGEGAGTRRKLISQTVKQHSKTIPGYQEEFDRALAKQDMAKAVREAKRSNTGKAVKKKVKKIVKLASAASAVVAGIYYVKNKEKIDDFVASAVDKSLVLGREKVSELAEKKRKSDFQKRYKVV